MSQFGTLGTTVPAILTLSGAEANMLYELTFASNRNNGIARISIFQITGADSFANGSHASIGTTAANNGSTTVANGDKCAGLAARLIQINPGQDGTVAILVSSSTTRAYINAMNLTSVSNLAATPELISLAQLGFGAAGILVRRRR